MMDRLYRAQARDAKSHQLPRPCLRNLASGSLPVAPGYSRGHNVRLFNGRDPRMDYVWRLRIVLAGMLPTSWALGPAEGWGEDDSPARP